MIISRTRKVSAGAEFINNRFDVTARDMNNKQNNCKERMRIDANLLFYARVQSHECVRVVCFFDRNASIILGIGN